MKILALIFGSFLLYELILDGIKKLGEITVWKFVKRQNESTALRIINKIIGFGVEILQLVLMFRIIFSGYIFNSLEDGRIEIINMSLLIELLTYSVVLAFARGAFAGFAKHHQWKEPQAKENEIQPVLMTAVSERGLNEN